MAIDTIVKGFNFLGEDEALGIVPASLVVGIGVRRLSDLRRILAEQCHI